MNRAARNDVVVQFLEEGSEEPYSASEVAALGLEDGHKGCGGGEGGDLDHDSGQVPEHPKRLRFRFRHG